ncbi:MAG TPA: DUF6064 family protein [Streptosporangiaceae bacterium]|nr:DUF6064 family protein [Streptosporangiaceae bacterium]
MHNRQEWAEGSGLAVALLALLVTYGLFLVHPWPHTPLNQFLAMFGRNNAAVWPAQIVWYAVALAVVGLALRAGRRSSQLACLLAAAVFAWIGIAYFVWLNPGMNLSWAWAAVFSLQAALLLVAGVARSDLVFRPRRDPSSVLGAVFISYALIVYPVIGLLGGHALRTVPAFGLAPCATVTFFFGLLLWARPPAPKYLLLMPLAWALVAAPPDLARGVAADYGMLVVAVITAALIIWRDRTATRQTVTAGLLLALMIGWSGHDNVVIGLALVLVGATLAQAIRGRSLPPQPPQLPPLPREKLEVG